MRFLDGRGSCAALEKRSGATRRKPATRSNSPDVTGLGLSGPWCEVSTSGRTGDQAHPVFGARPSPLRARHVLASVGLFRTLLGTSSPEHARHAVIPLVTGELKEWPPGLFHRQRC